MKRSIILIAILILAGNLWSQDTFHIPDPTMVQKHNRLVFMFWANIAPGIKFAKEQGVTPYDYGTYYGKQFGANRNTETGFHGYAQSILSSWAYFIREKDSKINIDTQSDSVLIFTLPSKILTDAFGKQGLVGISAQEMVEMMSGSHAQISQGYECSSKMELEGDLIIVTIQKLSMR